MASETKKRNALAVLAERMFNEIDGRRLILPNREDYEKARRIIAELAKVKDEDEYPVSYDYKLACRDAYEECREIADEGVGDGKCKCEICGNEYEPQQLHEGLCVTCERQMQEESWEVQDGK